MSIHLAGKEIDEETRTYIAMLARDPCSYCGATPDEMPMAVDHIVAASKGGPDHWTNLTIACCSCNSHKSKRDLLRFIATAPWTHEKRIPFSYRNSHPAQYAAWRKATTGEDWPPPRRN